MRVSTRLVRNGNSWSVRIPKQALADSGLKPGEDIVLVARPDRVAKSPDKYDVAKHDARKIWDEAFEQVWLDIFGTDE